MRPLGEVLGRHEEALIQIVDLVLEKFGKSVQAVVVVGSSVRGDFIPGYSDIDVHIYLRMGTFDAESSRVAEMTVDLQERVNGLGPDEFLALGEHPVSIFQVVFLDSRDIEKRFLRGEWNPMIFKGTHKFLYRGPGFRVKTKSDSSVYRLYAAKMLASLETTCESALETFACLPESELCVAVRDLGTRLKVSLYLLLSIIGRDARRPWKLSFADAAREARDVTNGSVDMTELVARIQQWRRIRKDPRTMRRMFANEVVLLHNVLDFCSGLDLVSQEV